MRLLGGVPREHRTDSLSATFRNRLLKIAVRVRETGSRIKLAFAANCPDALLFRTLIEVLIPRPT